jgi:hypothetical protein
MHLRFLHRDHRDRLDLGDRPEHLHRPLEHRILAHRLDVGYQNQHRLVVAHRPDEEHRLDEEHHPDLGEHRVHLMHLLDAEHQLGAGRGPCPGSS